MDTACGCGWGAAEESYGVEDSLEWNGWGADEGGYGVEGRREWNCCLKRGLEGIWSGDGTYWEKDAERTHLGWYLGKSSYFNLEDHTVSIASQLNFCSEQFTWIH